MKTNRKKASVEKQSQKLEDEAEQYTEHDRASEQPDDDERIF